jgi:hypothetical protein
MLAAAAAFLLASSAPAAVLSKKYDFKTGVILDIGAEMPGGLRIDNVRFEVPSTLGGKIMRVGGLFTAEVAVSNTGPETAKVGIAIALFDDQTRLLGVAGGGSKLASIKPGRQKSFTLVFDGVNAEAAGATHFYVSVEDKP